MISVFLFLKVLIFIALVYSILGVVLIILAYIKKLYKDEKDTQGYRFAVLVWRTAWAMALAPLILGPIFWFYASQIEPNWIEVKKINISSDRFTPGLKGLVIVQLSDLHIEKIGYREKKLIETVNRLKPDLILLNGDFINAPAGWHPALAVLKQLKAKQGVYSILGNTDYYFGEENQIISWLNGVGVKVFRHENVRLDFGDKGSFWLAGISDRYSLSARYGEPQHIDETFEGIPGNTAKIFLIPNPDAAAMPSIHHYHPDLILAGDTHGGQIGIAFLRQFSDYANRSEYMSGLFDLKGIPMYVNRGIGMKNLYIRFFCRPEITVIRLITTKK